MWTVDKKQIRGAALHVRRVGEGKPVLLVHGGGPGTDGEAWRPVARELAGKATVIVPDLPGFGMSLPATDEADPLDFAASLGSLIESLDLRDLTLVGHSMGSSVALKVALTMPDRIKTLVMMAPGGRTFGVESPTPGMAAISQAVHEPSVENMTALVRQMSANAASWDADITRRVEAMEVSHIRATQLGMLTRKRAPVTPDEIAALRDTLARAPFVTAVAWGEQEVFNPGWIGEAIKTQIVLQDEHYHIIPAAGHNIHSDNPAASAKVISQYL